MSDSTPFIDAGGIRRERPILPQRHQVDAESLRFLELLADLGQPGSVEYQGWNNLIQVHGFASVVRATARCFHQVLERGKVTNEQAQAVLDGKLPSGNAIRRHGTYGRRTQAT